ncbi:DGQHR domain-containing protein [Phaeobacter gallaeciensis]|uniref:DGQHR domain-containing protein n=1 Tax=Phaeobacter gallaeciensis TaxID=60890 RepID=UPI00237FF6F3|nr:DGQHR domain-containing protein [Phaeobacter gallaeciensis]MDE4272945.1 DGQHR domain-containing protein [Phaeobacter gallaeciensis]MDE4298102.1 DGQHR domain-containing protein [Phaeobacter gallaeciensis]MDE5183290.1 DGQHR domain-containing protein [Phaeobacter gallaeciensis]
MTSNKISTRYFEVTQAVGTFYSCVLQAQDLLKICQFDFRQIRENGGVKEFLGIQRPLKDDRVREIRKFISTVDASFPTSLVISVDERCAEIVDGPDGKLLELKAFIDQEKNTEVVPFDQIATIIDGQHRLKAFEGTDENWDLSVNVFVGVDEGTQAMLFSKVNLAQTKVNKSLVYDLFSLDKGRSPEKTCHELVVNLNDMDKSPFKNKIKRLGSATDGVFGETLSQATVVKGILPLITKDAIGDRDLGKREGFFPDRGSDDFERRIFYPFFRKGEDHKILATVINYYSALSERWPEAWENSGRGAVLPKTNGFNGSIRFLRDAYLHLTSQPSVPTKEEFRKVFDSVELKDSDFTTEKFPPGSSGASLFYAELKKSIA